MHWWIWVHLINILRYFCWYNLTTNSSMLTIGHWSTKITLSMGDWLKVRGTQFTKTFVYWAEILMYFTFPQNLEVYYWSTLVYSGTGNYVRLHHQFYHIKYISNNRNCGRFHPYLSSILFVCALALRTGEILSLVYRCCCCFFFCQCRHKICPNGKWL